MKRLQLKRLQLKRLPLKCLGLIAALLLAGVLNAHADNDIYTNIMKQARGDDALHADNAVCDQQFGAPQNGVPTPQAYKRCMLGRGWRFSHTVRERRAPDG